MLVFSPDVSDWFSHLRIGLWDPFQMAELHGLYMGVILTSYVRPGMILQVRPGKMDP